MSEKYGFEAIPKGERYYNRNRLKRIGYVMLEQKRTEEAIEIFEYWCSLYPYSSNAFDSLADALTRKGDSKKASQMRQKAKALAVQNEDYRLEMF
jgi:tetratricopeptide (TPR) repeat protein